MAKKGVGGGFIPHLGVVLYPPPLPKGGASLLAVYKITSFSDPDALSPIGVPALFSVPLRAGFFSGGGGGGTWLTHCATPGQLEKLIPSTPVDLAW